MGMALPRSPGHRGSARPPRCRPKPHGTRRDALPSSVACSSPTRSAWRVPRARGGLRPAGPNAAPGAAAVAVELVAGIILVVFGVLLLTGCRRRYQTCSTTSASAASPRASGRAVETDPLTTPLRAPQRAGPTELSQAGPVRSSLRSTGPRAREVHPGGRRRAPSSSTATTSTAGRDEYWERHGRAAEDRSWSSTGVASVPRSSGCAAWRGGVSSTPTTGMPTTGACQQTSRVGPATWSSSTVLQRRTELAEPDGTCGPAAVRRVRRARLCSTPNSGFRAEWEARWGAAEDLFFGTGHATGGIRPRARRATRPLREMFGERLSNVRANVWVSPGQRAERTPPSRTTQAGGVGSACSSAPLVLLPVWTSTKSPWSARASGCLLLHRHVAGGLSGSCPRRCGSRGPKAESGWRAPVPALQLPRACRGAVDAAWHTPPRARIRTGPARIRTPMCLIRGSWKG